MPLPTTSIEGNVFTPGGDQVIVGRVDVRLFPPGVTVADTVLPTVRYKIAGEHNAVIDNGIVIGLTLIRNQVTIHPSSYYLATFSSTSPAHHTWQELWRLDTNQFSLDIASVTVLDSTPGIGLYL